MVSLFMPQPLMHFERVRTLQQVRPALYVMLLYILSKKIKLKKEDAEIRSLMCDQFHNIQPVNIMN